MYMQLGPPTESAKHAYYTCMMCGVKERKRANAIRPEV